MSNFWLTLEKPFTVLAPMDDVTDFAFREVIALHARPDVLFTEFTCTDGLFTRGHERVSRRLNFSENQRPIVAQIWGATPENFLKSAQFIAELGFDGIDINMGCPDRAVIKKKSGSYLMNEPTLAGEIIEATKQGASGIPVSVKTRITGNPETTKKWLEFLLNQDIAALTIHARTPKAMSTGLANWEEIGNAVTIRDNLAIETMIIGNGDVKSYGEVLDKYERHKVDGVMIGRGIFANPWVFEKERTPKNHEINEYLYLLQQHTQLFWDTWEDEKNWEIMKKFFKMYINGFRGADALRQSLMNAKNPTDVTKIIETFQAAKTD